MNEQVIVQKQFFEYLINRKGIDQILEGMQTELNIKKGAIYKRMSGETALTSAELIKLAKFFDVSLDSIFQQDKYLSFEHPFLKQKSSMDVLTSFIFYLRPLGKHDNSKLTYVANELPVFYYFSHKYIFNFLLSIWSHLHWSDTRLVIEENDGLVQHVEALRKDITNFYDGHPVTEIWNSNMLANLYQQIIFSTTVRAFQHINYIRHLVSDIDALIQHLRNIAMNEYTDGSQARTLYLNEYANYLNLALYESDQVKTSFIGYDIPQFIVSYNPVFFEYSKSWIKKIKKRSVLISSEGYQNREMFFVKLEQDNSSFKDKLSKLMAVYYGEHL
jgi:hypothetical protein